jgi:hypothetical protein
METGQDVGTGESDSERRRRRRKRSKKKKDGLSRETRHLLMLARWGLGGLLMIATWGYGIWMIETLGWKASVFFPAGIAALVCIVGALAVPFITFLMVLLAFLSMADAGPMVGLRRAGMAFAAVGALNAAWQSFLFILNKRQVTRNEAGYK